MTRLADEGWWVDETDVEKWLARVRADAIRWLESMKVRSKECPEGVAYYRLCACSLEPWCLNSLTTAVELHRVLGLVENIPGAGRLAWIRTLQAYQQEDGLVYDRTWRQHSTAQGPVSRKTREFFTMTTWCALYALGGNFARPVLTQKEVAPAHLVSGWVSHHGLSPWGTGARVGILGTLARADALRGEEYALAVEEALFDWLERNQNPRTGLWGDPVDGSYVSAINGAFHIIRGTFGLAGRKIKYPERMIDIVLMEGDREIPYALGQGSACYDLDIALVARSAWSLTTYRQEELAAWAKRRLEVIRRLRRSDGGFSFTHKGNMTEHQGIRMAEPNAESDMWGTLMYLGAIRMLVEIAYPGVKVPWRYSVVHCIVSGE